MSQFTVDQALQIALQYQQTGQLPEAEDIYRQILAAYPDQSDALHLLGVLAYQCGRHDFAEKTIRQAIACALPGVPPVPYRLSLGSVLQAQNRMDDAEALYRETLTLDSSSAASADVYSHLGVALSAMGRYVEAVQAFEQAIERQPDHPSANGNLGIALCHLTRYDDAIRALRKAIAHQPKSPAFHATMGVALYRVNQHEAAVAACQQALRLDPAHGQANQTLSLVYMALGRLPEAAEAGKRASEALPEVVETQLNYGDCLGKLGRPDEAVALYRKAMDRHAESADLHTNLGNMFKDQGLLDEALGEFREAIRLRPGSAALYSNLLYTLQFHSGYSASQLFEEHRNYDRIHAQPLRREMLPHTNDRSPGRRLRIGYVSSEFRAHVVGLNVLPLVSHHDRDQVETFIYSDVTRQDFFTYRFQQFTDYWTQIDKKNDAQVAALICQDQIDILVDLNLHMAENRLLVFARKPAPIQMTFAGYPGTTGLSAIDYRVTDRHLDPPDEMPAPSSETPIRLAESFWCYYPQDTEVQTNTLPAKDLGYITLGNLNNFCKINEKTLELWALIMRGVTRSRLLMLAPEGAHRQRVQAFFEKRGIAADRIEFVPRAIVEKYLRYYHRIDLGLDSFPYNGHTTSLDSFYMGVPVVTMIGGTPVSRAGWSQLVNLGLPELAAKTPSEFVKLATELANDWPRLAELRSTMRARMEASPLMDQKGFTRSMESVFRKVWQEWCGGEGVQGAGLRVERGGVTR